MKRLLRRLAITNFMSGGFRKSLQKDLLNTKKRLIASLTFLEDYDKHDNEVLHRIVTGDEIWLKYVNFEMKIHSME